MLFKSHHKQKKGVQNGFYTARYGLKGCHRAVRTVPATQNREKAAPQARSNMKVVKIANIYQ
jgi:hypothetical protein